MPILRYLTCVVLVPYALLAQAQTRPDVDPRIETLLAGVSEARLGQLVTTLAGFGTRNTLSDTASSTRGIGAARQWIFEELRRSSSRLQVSFDAYTVAKDGRITRDVELRNVLAILPGRSVRRIYVTAHYDTVNIGGSGQIAANTRAAGQTAADPQLRANQDYNVDAPGANDNGSGTALTIELARVLATSGLEFDATIVFALWAGEEQGLVGSRAHLQRLAADKADDQLGIIAAKENVLLGKLANKYHAMNFGEAGENPKGAAASPRVLTGDLAAVLGVDKVFPALGLIGRWNQARIDRDAVDIDAIGVAKTQLVEKLFVNEAQLRGLIRLQKPPLAQLRHGLLA